MTQRLLLFCLFLLVSTLPSFAQATSDTTELEPARLKKNAIYVTLGTVSLAGAYNINYERMIVGFDQGSVQGLWAKAGVGYWGVWSVGGPYQSLTLGILTGPKSSHFELNAGVARMVNQQGYDNAELINGDNPEQPPLRSDYIDINPVGSMGYRYQKPGGHFLFRAGLGYPETLYVGLGVAF